MKKVLAIILALVMMMTASISVFAVADNFYKSPSRQPGPSLVLGENTDEDCFAWLEITGFSDRHSIPDETRKAMEDAYNQITSVGDLTLLCSELANVADSLNIPYNALAVSDLFDISWYGCDDHRTHGAFRVQIKPEYLENFVALLHYYNGEWVLVEGAEVVGNGDILSFTVDSLSPFAIIVDTGEEFEEPPYAGDNTFITAYIILMAVSGIALVGVGIAIKKGRKGAKV